MSISFIDNYNNIKIIWGSKCWFPKNRRALPKKKHDSYIILIIKVCVSHKTKSSLHYNRTKCWIRVGSPRPNSQRHSFFWIPHTRISLKQLRKPLDLEWTQKLRQILEYPKRAIFTIFMIFEADLWKNGATFHRFFFIYYQNYVPGIFSHFGFSAQLLA